MPSAAISTEEATGLAQAWASIAAGKAQEVAPRTRQLLAQHPRSVAVLATAIEADIAASGATTALSTYESWLGARTLEEPSALRRVARAVLYEWARQTNDTSARIDALVLLAGDGDQNARAAIAASVRQGQEAGLRASVRLKDAQAISQVAARLKSATGVKVRDINLLDEARSPLTAPILITLLTDPLPENRANAADALGKSGSTSAVDALLPVLKDQHGTVRTAAAGALYRLGSTAGLPILEELARNDSAAVRRTAAQLMSSHPDNQWMGLVRGLLADPDPSIRLDAARLLAPHDPATARAVLAGLAGDPNLAIREETELVRSELEITAFSELRALLRGATPAVRVRAAGRILAITR
jgi:hypothetical protein